MALTFRHEWIKQYLDNNVATYAGKTPAEIAVMMTKPIPVDPPEYDTVVKDKLEVIRALISQEKIDDVIASMITKGDLVPDDVADTQVQKMTRICDTLALGPVDQGDIEGALLVP